MPQSLLEEYERPVIDTIWKLDIQLDNISQWISHFERNSKMGKRIGLSRITNRVCKDWNEQTRQKEFPGQAPARQLCFDVSISSPRAIGPGTLFALSLGVFDALQGKLAGRREKYPTYIQSGRV